MSTQFSLPPDTRAIGTGNPPADMNSVVDALTAAPGVVLNVLNAAYAGGADPTGVSDSTAAIQAAINAAPYVAANDATSILGAAQATVWFPGGTYLISSGPLVLPHGHSIRLTGAGDGTILKSSGNAIIDFDGLNGLTEGSVEIDHLGFDATGGHVFQNANLHGQLSLHDLAIRQRSTGFSVFWMDDAATGHTTGLYQGIFRNIRYILDPGTRSVEAWHIVNGHGDGVTDLTWEHISGPVPTGYTGSDATMDNTRYQWLVTNTGSSGAHVTNIAWRNCIMSSPFGGIIKAGGAQDILIENVAAYNTFDRAISNSMISLAADPTGGSPVEGAVIRNYARTTALGSGSVQPPYDILLDSTCKNVLIENTVMGYSPGIAYINVGGASGVVVIQPGGGGAGGTPVISGQAADTVVIGQGAVIVGGTTIGAPAYDSLIASLTPAAWWKLADGIGSGTAADSSGNGWTGTASNITFGQAGPVLNNSGDTAASFNGSSSVITTSFSPSGLSAFSVIAWVNMQGNSPGSTVRILADDNTSSTSNGFDFRLNFTSSAWYPQLYVGNGAGNTNGESAVGSFPLPTTGWHCIVATVSMGASQTVQMYVDGVATGHSGSLSGTLTAGASNASIGFNSSAGGSHFHGWIGQVAFISGTTLTGAQATQIYNDGIAVIVNSVTAADTSVIVGGTATSPTLKAGPSMPNGVDVTVAGKGLAVAEGSNAKQGTATLSSGTATVSNTSVTANSRILLTAQDNSTTGALRVSGRTAATSFAITSSNAGDSGVVAFEIFEPG